MPSCMGSELEHGQLEKRKKEEQRRKWESSGTQPHGNKDAGKDFNGEWSSGGLNIALCDYVLFKRDEDLEHGYLGHTRDVESLHTNEGLSTAPQSSEGGGHTTVLRGRISIILVFQVRLGDLFFAFFSKAFKSVKTSGLQCNCSLYGWSEQYPFPIET